MADTKRDWGVWLFWVAMATLLVGASAAEYAAHRPRWGLRFLIAGLFLGGVCLVAIAAPPILAWVSRISRSTLGVLRWVGRTVVQIYAVTGAFFLRPFVEHIVRGDEATRAALPQPGPWIAGLNKIGGRGLDFRPLYKDGFRVSAAQFAVLPDYQYGAVAMGFVLASSADAPNVDSPQGAICYIFPTGPPRQTSLLCRSARDVWAPRPITPDPRKANFLIGLTIYPSELANMFQFKVNVDGATGVEFPIPAECARYLVLVAWADGQDFRVDFTQIHVSWVPE